MLEFFKKYGVLTFISLFFLGIVIYFASDTVKNTVPGKTIGGDDIIFSIGEKNVTADEYYDQLNDTLGISTTAVLFQMTVSEKAIETTEEMKTQAKLLADSALNQYVSQYGSVAASEEIIDSILRTYGFTGGIEDLDDYFLFTIKNSKIPEEYLTQHKDELIPPYMEESQPRILSHILIKMEDPENPSDEELEKIATVEEALSNNTSFEEVAISYSDDPGSAVAGGYLGLSDSSTSYVPEFLSASLALQEGETSEWIKTDYGYHLIRCDAATFEKIMELEPQSFYEAFFTKNPTVSSKALWEKSKELGVTFADEALEQKLLEYFGLNNGGEE